jgi:hypothetical protein
MDAGAEAQEALERATVFEPTEPAESSAFAPEPEKPEELRRDEPGSDQQTEPGSDSDDEQ